jgi:hypothetical protein
MVLCLVVNILKTNDRYICKAILILVALSLVEGIFLQVRSVEKERETGLHLGKLECLATVWKAPKVAPAHSTAIARKLRAEENMM